MLDFLVEDSKSFMMYKYDMKKKKFFKNGEPILTLDKS